MATGPKKIALNNDIDIYRLTKIINPSPEHIIHAGIGGDLEITGLIDHKTNTDFGGTIDKDLVEDFTFVRSRLGLRTRRGDPIRVATSAGEFDILGDVPVAKRTGRPWEVSKDSSGRTHIKLEAGTLERAMELKDHAIRSMKLEGKPIQDLSVKRVQTFAPTLQIELQIGGLVALRSVAKACLNALAFRIIPQKVLEENFNEIRSYVIFGVDHCNELRVGNDDPHRSLACFDHRENLFQPLPNGIRTGSDLEHRLVIRGCPGKCVYATVELFGHIPISVLLTDRWDGAEFCWAYVVDPLPGGEGHIRAAAPLDVRPVLSVEELMLHKTDVSALRPRLEGLISASSSVARRRHDDALVKETVMEAIAFAAKEGITSEQLLLERIRDQLLMKIEAETKRERTEEKID